MSGFDQTKAGLYIFKIGFLTRVSMVWAAGGSFLC